MTESRSTEQALNFLAALFQTAPSAALAILHRPGFQETLFDLVDLFPPTQLTSLPVAIALVDLVSQICNSAEGRTALLSSGFDWKGTLAHHSDSTALDANVRATSTVALAKLSRGQADPTSSAEGAGDPAAGEEDILLGKTDERLAVVLKTLIESSNVNSTDPPPKAVMDAIEGLALTSYRSKIKEVLSSSKPFLVRLFALVPPPPRARAFNDPVKVEPDVTKTVTLSSIQYGIATIISNVIAYKPVLNAEQAQIDRLRRMTLAKESKSPPADDPFEDDRLVARRVKRLLEADVGTVLVSLGRSDSRVVKEVVGKAYLSLVHDQAYRSTVIQSGGAKALLLLCSSLLATSSTVPPPPTEGALPTIQAFAKLLITSSPFTIFGPSASSTASDAIRPLSVLLTHESASLLQQFESLMALTNLASISPSLADRIASFQEGEIVRRMEGLMLDENVMVRRAATELLCNLLASERVFLAWSGEPSSPSDPPPNISPKNPTAKKLHVLLALTTVSDIPTQLAASGAIATVCSSPLACRFLLAREEGPKRPLETILELMLPTTHIEEEEDEAPSTLSQTSPSTPALPGLVHRAAVILLSVVDQLKDDSTVVGALKELGARGIVEEALEDVEHGLEKGDAEQREIGGLLKSLLVMLPERRDSP